MEKRNWDLSKKIRVGALLAGLMTVGALTPFDLTGKISIWYSIGAMLFWTAIYFIGVYLEGKVGSKKEKEV